MAPVTLVVDRPNDLRGETRPEPGARVQLVLAERRHAAARRRRAMSVATRELALGDADLQRSAGRRLSTFLYRHGGL